MSSENENEDVSDPSPSNASLSAASHNGQSSASLIPNVETVVEETANDGTKWSFISLGSESRGRRAARNVLTEEAGLSRRSRQLSDSPLGAFLLLMDSDMISLVQNCTNVEARRVLSNKDWNVSRSELLAFIALLYVRGAYGGRNIFLESYWNKQWGVSFFSETMARNRFREILRFLRFDMRSTRSIRLQADKFALVSDLWNKFVDNCISSYKPGPNITIDEQLFPTKARCRFTQYMPNKPDKFGIKFWLAVDVDTKYILNAIPYLGKEESRAPSQRLSDWVVMNLMQPYLGKGRNVTTDNFFTSYSLAKQLLQKKTSIVGTVNKVRRELPPSAKKQATRYSTVLLKTDDVATLTIYQCNPTKNVSVLSSLHMSVGVDSSEKNKPETIEFYNKTKCGVDVADQMARQYSVKASTRRWPVAVFYNILDLACINAFVLYKKKTGGSISRRDFIFKLACKLREDYIAEKSSRRIAPAQGLSTAGKKSLKRKQCQVAVNCKQNKTSNCCHKCNSTVCGNCTANSFVECVICAMEMQ